MDKQDTLIRDMLLQGARNTAEATAKERDAAIQHTAHLMSFVMEAAHQVDALVQDMPRCHCGELALYRQGAALRPGAFRCSTHKNFTSKYDPILARVAQLQLLMRNVPRGTGAGSSPDPEGSVV